MSLSAASATATKDVGIAQAETQVDAWFERVRAALLGQSLAPYLGPGLAQLNESAKVPASYAALAEFLGSKVALPRRARGNAWAAAQYIESRQHRATVTSLMKTAFATPLSPAPFHQFLAELAPPLIVDTWYDGALRRAFGEREDWLELQGVTRAGVGEARFYRAYDGAGGEAPLSLAQSVKTVVYKPHGSVDPAGNFLITDSDYVEVLTEIDIQTPLPEVVRERRREVGFLFLGCRFHDQMLRSYARQIAKRSNGPHYAVFQHELSRMEQRFVNELGISYVSYDLRDALARLAAS